MHRAAVAEQLGDVRVLFAQVHNSLVKVAGTLCVGVCTLAHDRPSYVCLPKYIMRTQPYKLISLTVL